MSMPKKLFEGVDMSHLVTEDDRPVDNRFSERQQRLLPHILFCSWEQGKPFEALSNVGLFSSLNNQDTVVPDFMLSLGVEPRPVAGAKEDRSYFTWVYGKAPDLVVEVVSNNEGEELTRKFATYARIRVTYYAIYDPFARLGNRPLRLFRLVGGRYVDYPKPAWMPGIGLGLTLWDGEVDGIQARWLRFVDKQNQLLPTAQERARAEQAVREREDILGAARVTILEILRARVGEVPTRLEVALSRIEDGGRLTDLSRAALRIQSIEEFARELSIHGD